MGCRRRSSSTACRPQVEILDQTTIRYTWALPNQAFLPALAAATPLMIYRPARYLKQFNPKYTSSKVITRFLADSQARRLGRICTSTSTIRCCWATPTCRRWGPGPSFRARGSQVFAAVRNPYYHRIDKDGQQLPYIDRLVLIPQSKSQILPAVLDGKSDLQATGLSLADLPALQGRGGQGQSSSSTSGPAAGDRSSPSIPISTPRIPSGAI